MRYDAANGLAICLESTYKELKLAIMNIKQK